MRVLITTLALSVVASSCLPYANADDSTPRRLPALGQLAGQRAQVSAFAVNLRTGQVLADENSNRRLTPASVTKVVLAAAALEKFGSEHTFKSAFFRNGSLEKGKTQGDLVFVGAGDPSLTNEKLWFLATDVARMGVREVAGDLVLNTSLFGPIERDSNRLAGQRASRNAYDSPLSAAAVNFSVLAVVAGPGPRVGAPAQVALEPYSLENFLLSSSVSTGKKNQLAATRVDKGRFDAIVASGSVAAANFPSRVYRSVSDADAYAGSTLRAFLLAAGVKVQGQVRVDTVPPAKSLVPVAQVESFALDWQLRGLFKVSNNFIGDMLTLQLGLDAQKPRGATLESGALALQDYARQSSLSSPYRLNGESSPLGLLISSGSGLTPENKLSARDVVAVLHRMHQNEREFPSFLAALPIAGAEGTVRKRFDSPTSRHLQGRVRAKTGTLTEPLDAVGLAGYSRTSAGDWVAFCFLLNGTSQKPNLGVERLRDAIDEDLATLLPAEK
jgi:serine-type D-Ala-D-Ala carboxypeptidase/endopeptidase (penicillin-binding protein 4)